MRKIKRGKVVYIRTDQPTFIRLTKVANTIGMSMSSLIHKACIDWLDFILPPNNNQNIMQFPVKLDIPHAENSPLLDKSACGENGASLPGVAIGSRSLCNQINVADGVVLPGDAIEQKEATSPQLI